MSRKMIMVNAHRIARVIVHEVGNYSIALQMALKNVWHAVNVWNKKRFTKASLVSAIHYLTTPSKIRNSYDGIPNWIMQKNLTTAEYQAISCDGAEPEMVKETEKAIDFKFNTDFGVIYLWCPKSVYAG